MPHEIEELRDLIADAEERYQAAESEEDRAQVRGELEELQYELDRVTIYAPGS